MGKQLKIGYLIKVRDCEGKLLDRRLVAVCGNLVFVCTENELAAAQEEGRSPIIVGWPIEDAGL
jgi:hypothetical protein